MQYDDIDNNTLGMTNIEPKIYKDHCVTEKCISICEFSKNDEIYLNIENKLTDLTSTYELLRQNPQCWMKKRQLTKLGSLNSWTFVTKVKYNKY